MRWEYQTTIPAFCETCMQVKKQQLEWDMYNRLVPNQERSKQGIYYHPAYLTYIQRTTCKMPGWMKHKLESRLPGEMSITSDSLVAQVVKHLPAIWETWVQLLCREDPLEKETATHSSTLPWKIPRMEEPGRLQYMGWQRDGHDLLTSLSSFTSDMQMTPPLWQKAKRNKRAS